MISTDGHGHDASTLSSAARDAYVEGCGLLLTLYPGSVAAFERAISADPGFALAHAGKARALQMGGDVQGAIASLLQAKALVAGLPARESSQIDIFDLLLSGQAGAALSAVRAHLEAWPRDAMVLGTTASQLGLIGMSGRAGREHELAALLESLAPHYGDDWWFNAHYGMALSEAGRQHEARPLIERSVAQNARNAYGAHAIAHLHYETGEPDAAIAFMHAWLPSYDREAMLYGHLSWHLALCELQQGNVSEAFRLYTETFASDECAGPALFKVIDATSFLWRSELAGHPRDPERWRAIHRFARAMFPRPGMPYADWHVALADAVAGDGAALESRVSEMEKLVRAGRYPAGPALSALTRAFHAFHRLDFLAAIDAIEPVLAERERIGGSRAQIDLVEFTLLKAYLGAGRLDDLRRLLNRRRPGPDGIPVAGLEAVVH